ncbi:hypothetical protein EB796_012121 [Bugula neritina]|uniref:Bleomycin hydrolase n=1 Tax=Bugula neritina TaxID=10212 RepID=A0A7J7JT51_BUGNE|nr:hypothetical protein EB796_012121 [Bugula neritina]
MASSAGIDLAIIDDWMKKYEKNEKLLVAQKGCTHFNTLSFLSNQQCNLNHVFNKKVSVEVKPVTNQKSSGRCWIYACLNVLRIAFCKQNSVEEFELSQTYIFFWDKVLTLLTLTYSPTLYSDYPSYTA